ncbi:trypsin-like serine protease [Streptomyces blastmyceticus]|uniref:trypsin-like serine protease n=1 Tax=Streptomyces blastmyceticus TaxID=68180 RepID=UPI0031D101EF
MAASLAVPTAHAVVGSPVADGAYAFTAKLDIGGGQRGCSGVLVDASWLVTAASCFADPGGLDSAAGAPPQKTRATIGRTDLTTSAGQVDDVVEIVPHADRDVVLARLARPVLDVVPVPVAAGAPVSGETLRVTGYGRTKDEWVPDRLQTAALSVTSVDATTLGLAAKAPADAGLCKGDTGGPVFREGDGRAELAGIASTSWQAGCFGSDETRTGAVGSRLDDIGPWIRETVSQGTDARFTWRSLAVPDQNKCVGLANAGSTVNGTELVLWDCHKHADQWWTVDPETHLLHSLAGPGRCVGLADAGSTKNGTHLVVWDCHGRSDQRWQLLDDYTVRSLAADPPTRKCVGLANGGSTANGTPLVLWDCHRNPDQRWKRGS